MITKNAKTVLFASLIAAMILPFSGMGFVEAEKANDVSEKQKVHEPKMTQLLKKIIKQTGKSQEIHKLKDSSTVKIDYDVVKLNDRSFAVHLIAEHKGEIVNEQNFVVTNNPDGSINMKNEAVGIDVDFIGSNEVSLVDENSGLSVSYSVYTPEVLGSGNSDGSGARIDLYDSGVKQPDVVLILDDSYSGCLGANAGSFDADVFSDNVSHIDWDANSTYWHWCVSGHSFNGGEIIHEGNTKNLSSSQTSGTWITTNTGINPYSVDVEYTYGSW